MKENFSSDELFHDVFSCNSIRLKLYEIDLIEIETIVEAARYDQDIFVFFANEINARCPDIYVEMTTKNFQLREECEKSIHLSQFEEDVPYRTAGINEDIYTELILKDINIFDDDFSDERLNEKPNLNNIFSPHSKLPKSIFEKVPILQKKNIDNNFIPTYLEYALFYGYSEIDSLIDYFNNDSYIFQNLSNICKFLYAGNHENCIESFSQVSDDIADRMILPILIEYQHDIDFDNTTKEIHYNIDLSRLENFEFTSTNEKVDFYKEIFIASIKGFNFHTLEIVFTQLFKNRPLHHFQFLVDTLHEAIQCNNLIFFRILFQGFLEIVKMEKKISETILISIISLLLIESIQKGNLLLLQEIFISVMNYKMPEGKYSKLTPDFLILKNRDSCENNLLYISVLNNNFRALKFFLNQLHLNDITNNENYCIENFVNFRGDNLLMMACRKNHIQMIKFFCQSINQNTGIQKFIDINHQSRYSKYSAFHLAIENDSLPALQLLFSINGINPNIKDQSGNTPLHLAVAKNKPQIVKFLLTKEEILLNEVNHQVLFIFLF
ncbi:hypothetical protein TRFO_05343 [Tritrichomonas foetus]|uniref:Uncharacterized protein n=1 Tax=Tritrichomonas foetus TaxID=1144522 RepID=A0A1J4K8A5_9EUKA|nr:hypothetical protein TRFO_05343 [Tritrichomonas foetus]|eukprot:OHT07112.1 hypothetical protein TRFO_05343 [Tritrichomonas foetus]